MDETPLESTDSIVKLINKMSEEIRGLYRKLNERDKTIAKLEELLGESEIVLKKTTEFADRHLQQCLSDLASSMEGEHREETVALRKTIARRTATLTDVEEEIRRLKNANQALRNEAKSDAIMLEQWAGVARVVKLYGELWYVASTMGCDGTSFLISCDGRPATFVGGSGALVVDSSAHRGAWVPTKDIDGLVSVTDEEEPAWKAVMPVMGFVDCRVDISTRGGFLRAVKMARKGVNIADLSTLATLCVLEQMAPSPTRSASPSRASAGMCSVSDARVHDIRITPTGELGINSGRVRYRVVCGTCKVVIHEGTTSPSSMLRGHLDGSSSYGRSMTDTEALDAMDSLGISPESQKILVQIREQVEDAYITAVEALTVELEIPE